MRFAYKLKCSCGKYETGVRELDSVNTARIAANMHLMLGGKHTVECTRLGVRGETIDVFQIHV